MSAADETPVPVRVRLLRPALIGERCHVAGDTVEVPDYAAVRLEHAGAAEIVPPRPVFSHGAQRIEHELRRDSGKRSP